MLKERQQDDNQEEVIIELQNESGKIRSNISMLELQLGNTQAALIAAVFAVSEIPNAFKPKFRRGIALLSLNRHAEAASAFESALESSDCNEFARLRKYADDAWTNALQESTSVDIEIHNAMLTRFGDAIIGHTISWLDIRSTVT